jgi:hypothetical protein
MYDSHDVDPLWMVVRSRQNELLQEADHYRQASQAKHKPDRNGFSIQPTNKNRITIWKRTAWTLGKAAFSLGIWLSTR